MSSQLPLAELLLRWEQAQEQGLSLSLEELCREFPDRIEELRQAVADLEAVDACLNGSRTDRLHSPLGRAGFERIEIVGEGGQGVVYKAWDTQLRRWVALKHLRPMAALEGDESLTLLRAEAQKQAAVRHPNILQIFNVISTPDGAYLVMEYADGGTLRPQPGAALRPSAESARLVETLALAVETAHQRGLIHRDLKPHNILLLADGTPKISDFGIAKRVGPINQPDEEATLTGFWKGSPPYLSPEQAAGRTDELSTRTDVYGLGAILYELLTGRPPFSGDSIPEILDRVQSQLPTPIRKLRSDCSPTLEAIALKCLRKDPDKRYPSAVALAEDLRRWLDQRPTTARPLPGWARLGLWSRRHPVAAALASALLLTVMLALVVVTSKWREAAQARQQEAAAHATAENQLYLQCIPQAHHEWTAGRVRRAEELLEHCPERLRGWEWDYLNRLCHPAVIRCRGHKHWVRSVVFSPDGKLVASASADHTVRLWDAATGRQLRTLSGHAHFVTAVAFSPDGQTLVTASWDGTILRWDVLSGHLLQTLIPDTQQVLQFHALAFHPEGNDFVAAAYVLAEGPPDLTTEPHVQLYRWNASKRTLDPWLRWPKRGHIAGLAFSPDSRCIALALGCPTCIPGPPPAALPSSNARSPSIPRAEVTQGDSSSGKSTLVVWELGEKVVETTIPAEEGTSFTCVTYNPTGRELAAGSIPIDGKGSAKVTLWNANGTSRQRTFDEPGGIVATLAFSPDARWLSTTDGDGMIQLHSSSDAGTITLRGHNGLVFGLGWSPSGDRLASCGADAEVQIWDMTAEARSPASDIPNGTRLAVSRAAPRLAIADQRRVTLWATDTGSVVTALSRGVAGSPETALSPDGQQLLTVESNGVAVWNVETGQKVFHQAVEPVIGSVAFRPDGAQIAIAAGPNLLFADAATGEVTQRLERHTGQVRAIAYNPDGQLLASTGPERTINLWDPMTGEMRRQLHGCQDAVDCLQFSPDGSILASAGRDHCIRLWDPASGTVRRVLRGHRGRFNGLLLPLESDEVNLLGRRISSEEVQRSCSGVTALTFTPDGQRLVSAGTDELLRVWDVNTGQQLLEFPSGQMFTESLVFTPDGKILVSAGREGQVRFHSGSVDSATVRGDRRAWHLRQAEESKSVGNLWGAAFHAAWAEAIRFGCEPRLPVFQPPPVQPQEGELPPENNPERPVPVPEERAPQPRMGELPDEEPAPLPPPLAR